MQFKNFITQQRVSIFIVGIGAFFTSLLISHIAGVTSLWGDLFDNLAASSVTIIFTAFIIDYFRLKEQNNKTLTAAGLSENEIRVSCFRIQWRLAQLYGFEQKSKGRENISDRLEARAYLDKVTHEVDQYLSQLDFVQDKTAINEKLFPRYLEILESSQTELVQVLELYEYALPYTLRERVLSLRNELQIAERVLGTIDASVALTKANMSFIRVTAQSINNAIEAVLDHGSRTMAGTSIKRSVTRRE